MSGSFIWLASYPKSGNTWLRLLLANLLSGRREAMDINEIDLPHCSAIRHEDLEEMTQIDTSLLKSDEVDALRPLVSRVHAAEVDGVAYVKVHDAYRILANGEPLLGRGLARAALYVLRDPRDVAVSYSFHNGTSIEQTISVLNSPRAVLAKGQKYYTAQVPQLMRDWSSHVESWVDQKDVPVHVIRYEDMHARTVENLRKAADFLGLVVSTEAVEQAVRNTEFTQLQRNEQESGFRGRPIQSTAPFFRSGRAGGWREVLSHEQQQAITDAHQRVMARFGYI